MTDTLFIRLRTAPADIPDAECCIVQNGVASAAERLPLSALAERSVGHRAVAFIPTADTLAMLVALPPMSASKVRAALPYAVEEQLAGDAEDQHFALGRRLEDGRWPVRIVAHARIASYLAALRGAGVEPQAIVAEADVLHDKPGDMMLWLDGDDSHWRAPGQETVSLPVDSSDNETLVQCAQAALGATPARTLGLRVYGEPAALARHAAALGAVGERFLQVATQPLEGGPIRWLAAQYDAAQTINLLQGDLAPQRGASSAFDAWRWPLRLAALIAVIQLVGWGVEAWRLQRATESLEPALLAAARPIDPSLQSASAAGGLLRARLAVWDRGERDPSRVPLLRASATLAAARAVVPAFQVVALRQHQDGTVTGRFAAGDAGTRSLLRSTLLADGWREASGAGTDTDLSLVWSASP